MPDGLESSSTNIASDHGVGNARRSIATTCGQVGVGEAADLDGGGGRGGHRCGGLASGSRR